VLLQQLLLQRTEEYDGTAWTAGGNLGTARSLFSRLWNTNSRTLAFGGGNTTVPVLQTQKNMMAQAWTAGGNLNTGRFGSA
jgi:hypothetical protein